MRLPHVRLSRQSYLIVTIAGVLLPTLVLSLLGLYFVQRLFHFQREILGDYSRFSVEYAMSELQRHIREEERDAAQQLQLAALVDRFAAADELRRLEEIYPIVAEAYVVHPDGSLAFASVRPGAPADSLAARAAERARAERLVRGILEPDALRHVQLSGEIHYYAGTDAGSPYQMAAFPLMDSANRPRGVAGFFLDLDVLRGEEVARVLDSTIHAAEGRFGPEFGSVLTLVVRDHQNQSIYTHSHAKKGKEGGKAGAGECRSKRFLATAELSELLPGWKVGLTYVKPSGFGWTRRIVVVQMALLLLAATLVIIGTIFSMRFSLRQMELSRLKSHFVSNITHELKTPLAAIRLYTETLQQGRVRDRAEADRFLGIIHKESVRLTQLINNILDFARIEDGRRRYKFAPASVGGVVREVADAYAYQLRNKGFDLKLDIEDGLPPALVDRDALGQAVLNLLDNAVKYSRDDKRVGIEVRRAPEAPATLAPAARGAVPANGNGNGGGAVLIAVRDHGIGIAPADQAKIFEAFYRVEKGLEHDVKGSGLGLAVVKHIVEAHGGTIGVESRPGAGSTFTIRLPLREAAEPVAHERSA